MARNLMLLIVIGAIGCQAPATRPPVSVAHHATYTDRSLADAARLSPEDAKLVLIARAMGCDLSGGFKGVMGFTPTVFEIFAVQDGWYVFCHGGMVGDGTTIHISRSWTPGRLSVGSPPVAVTAPNGSDRK